MHMGGGVDGSTGGATEPGHPKEPRAWRCDVEAHRCMRQYRGEGQQRVVAYHAPRVRMYAQCLRARIAGPKACVGRGSHAFKHADLLDPMNGQCRLLW